MNDQIKRLYRSRKERIIGGVCGGLGEFFAVDPTLIRLLFILGAFLGFPGATLLVYLVLLVIVPEEPAPGIQRTTSPAEDFRQAKITPSSTQTSEAGEPYVVAVSGEGESSPGQEA